MAIYDELGVTRLINAAGTYTRVGGSRMSDETLRAMREAANSFVNIEDLQKKLNARLAELTHNEAAYVTTGAAAGLFLTAAACVSAKLGQPAAELTPQDAAKCEIITFKVHRNPYDWGPRQLGVRLVEVASPNCDQPLSKEQLQNAITDKTAAIFYTISGWLDQGALDLQDTIAIAQSKGIPLIIDAAAQLPPVENLWNFTEAGATAVLFSGGKDLCGPQASGLIVGKKWLIDILMESAFPNNGIGRVLKVGREEMVGLFAAIKQYLDMDHGARARWCEEQVDQLRAAFMGNPDVAVERSFPNEAGQPLPRGIVTFLDSSKSATRIAADLLDGSPAVYVRTASENSIFINPMTLAPGELIMVIDRLKQILRSNP